MEQGSTQGKTEQRLVFKLMKYKRQKDRDRRQCKYSDIQEN